MINACVVELEPLIGTGPACRAAGKSKATHYRHQRQPVHGPRLPRSAPANALTTAETEAVLAVLRSARFRDLAPAQIWAVLLDEGRYLASISTMYRVLRRHGEVNERRNQATHPARARPELIAEGPNECWSWDITKLRGPDKGVWFDLYIIIDIFSRYVPQWMIEPTETAELAEAFIDRAVKGQNIVPGTLNIHADRGTSMTSKKVAELLADLGISRTHSRPHVSNDNPYSEAVNKTITRLIEFAALFNVCHAISIAITTVLPVPVAILCATRNKPGLASSLKRRRSLTKCASPWRSAHSARKMAVSNASI